MANAIFSKSSLKRREGKNRRNPPKIKANQGTVRWTVPFSFVKFRRREDNRGVLVKVEAQMSQYCRGVVAGIIIALTAMCPAAEPAKFTGDALPIAPSQKLEWNAP